MAPEKLESWTSPAFAEAWAGEDVLADLLSLPRRISASLVADARVDVAHEVDVGSGPGAYLQVFLEAFPTAQGTWLDASDAMERLGRENLAAFGDRVTYVRGDAERLDELELERAQVVLTSRVLHHFSPASVERFYRTAFALLTPGGFFFNLDHFGTPPGWETRYRRVRDQFTGGRKRDLKPHRHDFPLAEPATHLAWLDGAGFEPADTPSRTFFTALLAARKAP